jgi:LytS/YehU family sensor histidine kinase
MNTLNNIHALIDLDTEKAKDVVIELSRLMRYVLYDSSQPYVSLKKEIAFLYNYIGLMKIRYTDDVDIRISVPEVIPDVKIPPLLFMSFIENAFKHGISYQSNSYIYTVVGIDDDKLSFMVENSSYTGTPTHQGVGLDNIKKRLQLIYQNNYSLHIEDTSEKYKVILTVPVLS